MSEETTAEPDTFSVYRGRAYLALGRAERARGKNVEALSAFRSATKHLEKTLGTEHPESRAARQLAASVFLGGIYANRQ
jgi:hypothetical protein